MPSGSNVPILPPVPGTPNGPGGSDPGINPDPFGLGDAPAWMKALGEFFRSAGIGRQAIDALPAVKTGPGPVVKVPTPTSTDSANGGLGAVGGALNQFVAEVHQGIMDLESGLPIFGTFALLAVVFVVGLVMFLSESGGDAVVASAAGAVGAGVQRRRARGEERKAEGERAVKQQASDDAKRERMHERRNRLHARGKSALTDPEARKRSEALAKS